jgi:hypothetical protein
MKISLKTKIEIVSFANNLLQDLVGITTSLQIKIYLFLNKKNFYCPLLKGFQRYPLKNSYVNKRPVPAELLSFCQR